MVVDAFEVRRIYGPMKENDTWILTNDNEVLQTVLRTRQMKSN
jgi:hypothetical protein